MQTPGPGAYRLTDDRRKAFIRYRRQMDAVLRNAAD